MKINRLVDRVIKHVRFQERIGFRNPERYQLNFNILDRFEHRKWPKRPKRLSKYRQQHNQLVAYYHEMRIEV